MTHAFFKALLFMTAGLVDPRARGRAGHPQDARASGSVMPWTKWCFLAGALALVGIPPFARLLLEGPDHRRRRCNIGWYGCIFWVCGSSARSSPGLYTFRLWFLVFPGEPSPFVARALPRPPRPRGRRGRCSCRSGSSPCSRRSAAGSSSRRYWDPLTNWLEPVAPTLADRRADELTQETVTSVVAVLARPRRHRRRVGDLRRAAARGPAAPVAAARARAQVLLRLALRPVFYAPAVCARRPRCAREFEEPVVLQAGTDLGETTLDTGGARPPDPDRPAPHVRLLPRRRRGRPRPRLPDRQMNASYFTSLLIWLPIAARDRRLAAAALALRDRERSRCSSRSLEVGIWIEQAAHFDFSQPACRCRAAGELVRRPRRLVPRRRVRLLALARRPHRRRDGGVRSATASGSAATGRARTSG